MPARLGPPVGPKPGRRPSARALAALALAASATAAVSCGDPFNQMVEDHWELAESSGAPVITEITDLGGSDVPLRGQLGLGGSDGVAAIGETLWIHGRSFGRQPTVSVGGRPAAVLGRTHDGGAVVRVPAGTPSGPQAVAVSNERGRGEKSLPIRRYAAVMPAEGGQVAWVELTERGPIAAGVTPVPGARLLALSADGRAAYVADPRGSVVEVLEIPAATAPKSIYRLDLTEPSDQGGDRASERAGDASIVALSAASRAAMLAVVRPADVVLLDTSSPLHPARSLPRALPKTVRDARIAAAELSPDGKLLAAVTEEGNRLVLLDLVPRGQAPLIAELPLAPDLRVGILIDVAFSPDGQTLWVLAGDTAASRPSGPQPTQLLAVRLRGSSRAQFVLELARTVAIAGAVDPLRLSTGRARPLASGAAIRLPPEKATVYLSARARPPAGAGQREVSPRPASRGAGAGAPSGAAVFSVAADDAAIEAASAAAPGAVGKADLSPDGHWLLAPAALDDGSTRVIAATVDGQPGEPRSVEVIAGHAARPPASASGAGGRPPELRIQP
jgi:hypothetical protein